MEATVQDTGPRYKKTNDLKKMLTHRELSEAIRKGWDSTNIREVLPARTATNIRYEKGAKAAVAWEEGQRETTIGLPLQDGWYVPDGNLFGLPNGRPSSSDDPEALYLYRHQDRAFSGPLVRGFYDYSYRLRRRVVLAGDVWSVDPGVALVGRDGNVASDIAPIVRSAEQSGAAAPLVEVFSEKLVNIANPDSLLQRAGQLETAARELTDRLGESLTPEAYARLIQPTLDEAAFLRELAGKIEAIQSKA